MQVITSLTPLSRWDGFDRTLNDGMFSCLIVWAKYKNWLIQPPGIMLKSQLWWNGSQWLRLDRSLWETRFIETLSLSDFLEARKTALVKNSSEEWNIFHTISIMKLLRRVFVYILRFIDNSKKNKIAPVFWQQVNWNALICALQK